MVAGGLRLGSGVRTVGLEMVEGFCPVLVMVQRVLRRQVEVWVVFPGTEFGSMRLRRVHRTGMTERSPKI